MTQELELLTDQLVRFQSTEKNPKETVACLDFCVKFFDGLPVTVHRFERNGAPSVVIQTVEGTELDTLIVAHIDVGDGPDDAFKTKKRDGRLYGRGVVDMKAFVATSLVVLRDLLTSGYWGSLGLMLVTDEERGGRDGAGYLVNEIGYRAKVVLVPDDGDSIATIVEDTKHMFTFEFSAKGRAAHGNRPWDGANAIEMLLRTLERLRHTFPIYESVPPSNWVNTLNLGIITGGIASNEVPADARMSIDIRVVAPTTREKVMRVVEESLEPGVSARLVVEGYPTSIDKNDPLIQTYCSAIKDITGENVRFKRSGGGTDGRYFAAKGMTVIVHQGTGGDAQGEHEFVEIDSLASLVAIQKAFILKQFPENSRMV